jgi:ACT domain-containing protein
MNDLQTELNNLEEREFAYVIARSKFNSDNKAIKDCGISSSTFYSWEENKREKLNELAQKFKRETAIRVLMIMQDNAERAAKTVTNLLDSRNESIKLKASQEVLDRSVGKVSQSFEVSGKDGGAIVVEFGEPIPPRSDD